MKLKNVFAFLLGLLLVFSCSKGNSGAVKFTVVYGAAHGDKCFTTVAVAVNANDGKIVDAFIDEYQYLAAGSTVVPVPNGDKRGERQFGANNVEGFVLASKKVNDAMYSKNMKDKAESTVSIKANYNAIEAYARGKAPSEIKSITAVSGATLADTKNYLALIAEAAEKAKANTDSYFADDLSKVKIVSAEYAAHGEQGFALVANVVEGNTILAAFIDEFQYLDKASNVVGVPNSDKGFGENYIEGKILCSKKQNTKVYSQMMADIAGATLSIDASYAAIEDFAKNKAASALNSVDGVSGSTLADTSKYLKAIAYAVENSK